MNNVPSTMELNKKLNEFADIGYVLISLPHKNCIKIISSKLEDKLAQILGESFSLKDYHHFVENDDQHIDIHLELLQFIHESQIYLEVLTENLAVFESLLGPDLDAQVEPHLRIARPGKYQDNIGFHSDIDYGNTSYEMSCVIALNKMNEEGALKVLPSSHAQRLFATVAIENEKAPKGSKLNKLGVPYQFKKIVDESYKEEMLPIPMNCGEVLCFNLGVVHGQEVNLSEDTRWTIDVRLKNILAPTNTREGYYKPFSKSPMTLAAEKFIKHNPH